MRHDSWGNCVRRNQYWNFTLLKYAQRAETARIQTTSSRNSFGTTCDLIKPLWNYVHWIWWQLGCASKNLCWGRSRTIQRTCWEQAQAGFTQDDQVQDQLALEVKRSSSLFGQWHCHFVLFAFWPTMLTISGRSFGPTPTKSVLTLRAFSRSSS